MLDWTHIATFFAIAAPLAGVPLTLIALYLRALREQYTGKVTELANRVERLDGQAHALSQRLTEIERSSTTREEWIRENMLARKERRLLTNAVIRIQCHIQSAKENAPGAPFFANPRMGDGPHQNAGPAPSPTKPTAGHGPPPQADPPTKDDS